MIKSGKFQVLVSFNQYPMVAHFIYKDQLMVVNAYDLACLRVIVKKAIKKAEQLAPSEEDKQQGNLA